MKHDYGAAVENFEYGLKREYRADDEGEIFYGDDFFRDTTIQSIRTALRFMEALQRGPSDAALESGYSAGDGDTAARSIFNAMIKKMMDEVGNG